MSDYSYIDNANPAYVEDLYERYLEDNSSVDPHWAQFFEGYDFAADNAKTSTHMLSDKEVQVMKLINAYRGRGHLIATTNPIRPRRLHQADLHLEYFGLEEKDLETEFEVGAEIRLGKAKLKDIIAHLKDTYCSSIGAEYRHITRSDIRQWLHEKMEVAGNKPSYTTAEKKHILHKLAQSVGFEKFLHVKYVGQKRFSMEGMESAIAGLDALFEEGARLGVKEFVMGMPHRGRLNVLTNLFHKPLTAMLTEFEGGQLPDHIPGDGDVKYHMGHSADVTTSDGHDLHLSLAANPSHLEAVNPVVMGGVKAKCEKFYDNDINAIVPVLVHGDAAIAGQGIVYECANMIGLPGYTPGGTIHVVFNNQVGFTANYRESRSSLYCTDIAKMMGSPVFHVNADDVEAVAHAMQMAIQIRQKFGVDVYVDVLGYRRYGHNEGDEPRFTQPLLYERIKAHPTVFDIYTDKLAEKGDIDQSGADAVMTAVNVELQDAHDTVREEHPDLHVNYLNRQWENYKHPLQSDFEKSPETGVDRDRLQNVIRALTQIPDGMNILKKLRKIIAQRGIMFEEENLVDWGVAEQLAYGTLLEEGHSVRLSGQDSRSGTFSHRHAVLIDQEDETEYMFLDNVSEGQADFQVYNSHLSEYGVLGFEYGYSLANPHGLTIWEAQFGDFSNGAQIIIDQFISASASKWQRMSGLVMYLPHGYEGQGPEHSSARLERYLSLAAENNICVAYPTTPANLFHLLRRQVKVNYRIPLVVMTPKSLLRNVKMRSSVDELINGSFQEIIDDANVTTAAAAKKIDRVILCAGKIYYELEAKREELGLKNVAIVRIEQFYPTPKEQDKALFEKYADCEDWVWVQEEPQNMGGWYYMRARLDHLKQLRFISRKKSASPAHGSGKKEAAFQEGIINNAFDGL